MFLYSIINCQFSIINSNSFPSINLIPNFCRFLVVLIVNRFLKQFFQGTQVKHVKADGADTFINRAFVGIGNCRSLYILHENAGFFHDGLVCINLAAHTYGDGDGVGGTSVNHRQVVTLFAHQHGVINAVAEAVDNHLHDFDTKLLGETDKEVVGLRTAVLVLLDTHSDGLGFGTPDDDR